MRSVTSAGPRSIRSSSKTSSRPNLATEAELESARATLGRTLPGRLEDGSFVDPAVTGLAAQTVALANRYGVSRRIGA